MLNQHNIDPNTALAFDCYNMDEVTAEWYEELISTHSHDVNGRIMSLKLTLYLLEKQPLSADMQRLVDRLKLEVDSLTDMVKDLRQGATPCDA